MKIETEPKRAVIEFSWRVLCALLELPEDTQFVAATQRGDGMIGLVIEHDRLPPLDELGALPIVGPTWTPLRETCFKGWVKVG